MNIVVIANGYPTHREPQYGCFEKDQAIALKKMGHNVSIFYLDERFRLYWRRIGVNHKIENEIDIYGIYLFPRKCLSVLNTKLKYKIDCRLLEVLYKRYIKDFQLKPDLLYAHYLTNIAISVGLKKKYDIPLVGIEHWSELTKNSLALPVRYLGNIAYNGVDKLLSVSQSLQSHIFRHFRKTPIVVYDMLGQDFVSSKPIHEEEFVVKFQFIAIGSMVNRKGFDLLLNAFNKADLMKKGCKLIIIGDGPERIKLQKQSELLGISEAVKLVGRKTKKEIIRLLQESHTFVLSSRSETFGVVCIEAMSQGLPIIATICGGPEEFINVKNGILIPTEDVNALARAMINMFTHYGEYNKIEIAKECKQRFAPQVIANQLTDIFEDVINN